MAEEKKIRVLMVCAMGMSSSLIETKTAVAAAKANSRDLTLEFR